MGMFSSLILSPFMGNNHACLGTEITIYGVLVYSQESALLVNPVPWNVSITLTIDGSREESFRYDPPYDDDELVWNYDSAVLRKSGLSNTTHTVRVDIIPPSQFVVCILLVLVLE
jgi:hypothetical protein